MWKAVFYRFESKYLNPALYYVQWVAWCWRKPIYIGLPLVFLTLLFLAVDAVLGLLWVFSRWGRS